MADTNAPEASPAPTEQATLTANTDQNGIAAELTSSAVDALEAVAEDLTQSKAPIFSPEFQEQAKTFIRSHIGWVQAELEHARLGTPAAEREKLNP